jgi:hypothetical protein
MIIKDTLHAHEIIPYDLHPVENSTIFHKDVKLSWEEYENISNFRLQVSSSRDFNSLDVDTLISKTNFVLNNLNDQAEYFWRVSAILDGHENDFSELNFFKTTCVIINGQNESDKIKLIPTHIDENDVLYIDNPNVLTYQIDIVHENKDTKFQYQSASERMALTISKWPRGKYHVSVSNSVGDSSNRQVILH